MLVIWTCVWLSTLLYSTRLPSLRRMSPILAPTTICHPSADVVVMPISQTPLSLAGGHAVATPRPSARQKRYSAREVGRRHSAPPAREGRGCTAGGQTTSGSVQEAIMRNGRKRLISFNPVTTKYKKPSRRGFIGACGFRVHGETSDWQDPCDGCGKVSHKDKQLCDACHREPSRDKDGNPLWKHFQPGVVDAAREWWAAARKNSSPEYAVRSDYEPSVRCLCSRSDCVFKMYVMHTRVLRCCDTCGSRTTVQWRKAGISYGYMRNFFTAGKGATKTKDYLANNGGSINTESEICNKCCLSPWPTTTGGRVRRERRPAHWNL